MRTLVVVTALVAFGCASKSETVKPDTVTTSDTATSAPPATRETRAFTAELVDEGAPMPPGMKRQVTVQGEKIRMEMQLNDRQSVQIYRGKGQPVLILDPVNKTFTEMSANALFEAAATAMDVPDLQNPCAAWRSECTRVGEEQLDGRKVTKWTTQSRAGGTVTLFVDESLFHLLRVEEGTAAKALKNVRVITPDDSLFAVPEGFTAAPKR